MWDQIRLADWIAHKTQNCRIPAHIRHGREREAMMVVVEGLLRKTEKQQ